MIQIKNEETGEVESIEEKDLPSAVQEKNVLIPNKKYTFEDEDGKRFQVPADLVKEELSLGSKFIPDTQVNEENLAKKYEGKPLAAILASGARGLTFGLSDLALTQTGAVDPDTLKGLKLAYPGLSTATEITGAVLPTLFTGGASAAASGAGKLAMAGKVLAKTPAGLVNTLAAEAGKRASGKVTSEFAKKIIQSGTDNAIQGALQGIGIKLSEDAIDNKDFNAESVLAAGGLGALVGGGIGGAVGTINHALGKGFGQVRKQLIDSTEGLTSAEKKAAKESIDLNEEIDLDRTVFQNEKVKAIAAENGWITTPGMESSLPMFKRFEASIAESPFFGGFQVSKKLSQAKETAQKEIGELVKNAEEISLVQQGDALKSNLMAAVNEKVQPARAFFNDFYKTYGGIDISERIQTMVINRMKNADVYKLGLEESLVNELIDGISRVKTVNQANLMRKSIGAKLGAEYASDKINRSRINILQDAYKTLKRAEIDAVEKNLDGRFAGSANVISGLKKSYKAYKQAYETYKPLFKRLGVQLKDPDVALDILGQKPSEKLAKKILDLNDYNGAKEIYEKFPELYDIGRKSKLAEFTSKITTDGEISLKKAKTELGKLTKEQKDILFGFDGKSQKRIDDIITYIKSIPDKANPSGSAIEVLYQMITSPIYQAKELGRYLLYRAGDKALGDYLNKTIPATSAIEKANNKVSISINQASKGFLKALKPAVTIATLKTGEEKDIERAEKVYNKLNQDPENTLDTFTSLNNMFYDGAPKTASATHLKMVAAANFLKSKMPLTDDEYIASKRTLSKSELSEFADYVEAVEKPLKALKKISDGYVSPKQIEAIKVVYPEIYSRMVEKIMDNLPKQLSRSQKNQLQLLIGAQVQPASSRFGLQVLQSNNAQSIANQSSQPVQKTSVSGLQKINQAGREQGNVDRILYRRA